MAGPSPETVEKARRKLEQAKARFQRLEARASVERRKLDARRKIIAGALLLDAFTKGETITDLNDLKRRISRDVDLKAFEGWSATDER
jgi:hypothetical protein